MLPRIFPPDDPDGQRAQGHLQGFQEKLSHVATLRSDVGNRLLVPAAITDADFSQAVGVQETLEKLTLHSHTTQQLQSLHAELSAALGSATAALNRLESIGASTGQSFQGDTESLQRVLAVVETAHTAPRELLGFRHAALEQPSTVAIIGRAQTEFARLGQDTATLDAIFYLDTVEGETQISSAVAVLRAGKAWYRIFQGSWRSACATHRLLDRLK